MFAREGEMWCERRFDRGRVRTTNLRANDSASMHTLSLPDGLEMQALSIDGRNPLIMPRQE